jgi:nitrite reductase/ring-hydroxylating ferredoxin subunit
MTTTVNQAGFKKQGAEDAGRYFRYMAEFVGFTQAEAEAIRETRFIIEKYIPEIVSKFYAQLLRYPPTRKYFMKKDGTLDQDYLQLRMRHLGNFWRRTASGVFDDEYARYVDYVGRAHTSHGADPHIYIPERYVIGQVGFIQHAISEAIVKELHDIDPEWEIRALRAWNLLMMVILEMLSRAYGDEREPETYSSRANIDQGAVLQLAVETYELGLGMRLAEPQDVVVGPAADIPDGERKIVQVDDLSIGVFHHKGGWYAVRNSCQHRGGPVATGSLEGDTLTCPWHGYKYNVTNGQLLTDPDAKLDMYPVEIREGEIHLQVPVVLRESVEISIVEKDRETPAESEKLEENEFRISEVGPGHTRLVHLRGQPVAVYNVDGGFYATQDACTHADGPLSEGDLKESTVICPWHGSCFDVTTGAVTCGPATRPLRTYRVVVEGEIGRVL